MSKKKIFLLSLISILTIFTLIGCGNKETTSQANNSTNMLSEGKELITERVGLAFDMSSDTSKYFTIYGKTEGLEQEFYYNSALINQKLLASADTKINYNSSIEHNLVLLAEDGSKGKIKINDKEYSFDKNNELIVELAAGEYTITSTSVDLCYILIYEKNDTIEVTLESGIIAFSLSDVIVDAKKDYTIYTFYDGTELQVNNDGTTKILKYGDNDLFGLEETPEEMIEEKIDETTEEIIENTTVENVEETIENELETETKMTTEDTN